LIDLNHILLFVAVVSPLILLARIARLRNPQNHGWRIAALIVLAGCVAAWLVLPAVAGIISGILWCLLLLIPRSRTERSRTCCSPGGFPMPDVLRSLGKRSIRGRIRPIDRPCSAVSSKRVPAALTLR
jgi:hypothetical protein